MDKTVAYLNIQHYQRLLATETDEDRRQLLLRLLAEEKAKISAQNRPKTNVKRPSVPEATVANGSDARPDAPEFWRSSNR